MRCSGTRKGAPISRPQVRIRICFYAARETLTGPNLLPTRFLRLISYGSRGFLITRIGTGWQTINAFQPQLSRSPSSLAQMLVALDSSESAAKQVVIAGKPDAPDTSALLREVNYRYQPNEILILADGGPGQAYFTQKIEFFKDVHPIDDRATAYVCQNFVCQLPSNDLAVVSRLLDTGKSPPTDNRAKQDTGKQ